MNTNILRLLNEAGIHFESFPGGRDGQGMALLYEAIAQARDDAEYAEQISGAAVRVSKELRARFMARMPDALSSALNDLDAALAKNQRQGADSPYGQLPEKDDQTSTEACNNTTQRPSGRGVPCDPNPTPIAQSAPATPSAELTGQNLPPRFKAPLPLDWQPVPGSILPADNVLVVAKWAPVADLQFQTIQVAFRDTGHWYAWHYGTFASRLVDPIEWTPIHAETPHCSAYEREVVARVEAQQTCDWTPIYDDDPPDQTDHMNSGCGEEWMGNGEGDSLARWIKFCPFCGLKAAFVAQESDAAPEEQKL